ncbi:MAG: ADOP family duplicated permease [Acidobacteriota bacterium]
MTTREPNPPRLARQFVAWRFSGERQEIVLGDLDEAFRDALAGGDSTRRASLRYWRQALASLPPRRRRFEASFESVATPSNDRHPGVLDMSLNDFRHTGRFLLKSPWWTIAVVLTIALAIGANTAVFSVVNAVMLRPLPFDQPDRLVWIAERNDRLNLPTFAASILNYSGWKSQARSFEAMGAFGGATFTLTGSGEPEQFAGGQLTPSLFGVLGLRPVAGRSFADGDDRPGAPLVIMISDALWRHRFNRDSGTIGRHVTVNGVEATIVGVAPTALAPLAGGDIWRPLTIDPGREMRLNHWVLAVGRLRSGVTLAAGQAEMDGVARNMSEQYAEMKDWGVRLVTFHDFFLNPQLGTALLMLLCAVGCVLLIASANVANLLLARSASRRREMAVRVALGASRTRIIRQVLAESLALSAIGGVSGLALAAWAVPAIDAVLPANLLPVSGVRLDVTVIAFAVALTVATGLLFGIAPAWRSARLTLTDVLKGSGRGATSDRKRLGNVLAAVQLALATMLLVAASLLTQSLLRLQHVTLGFDAGHVLTFQLALPSARYADNRGMQFYQQLMTSLRASPGVQGAAVSSGIPFGAGNFTTTPIATTGPSPLPPDAAVPTPWRIVSSAYFKTMRIPLLRGREFLDADGVMGANVVIVSQATARRFWGEADPLGRTLHRQNDRREYTVVGVVGDVRHTVLSQESPSIYYSSSLIGTLPPMDVVVRTDGDPTSVLPLIRQQVRQLDPALPVSTVRTMEEWVSTSAAPSRLNAVLMVAFAVVALSIAAIGIYGVLAYSVNQRTREIGLRMALGAQRGEVLRLIVREGMKVGALGIAIGLVAAMGVSRSLASLVFGVTVRDPWTYVIVAATLGLVALAACALPARRASRVDPVIALRQD